MESMRLLDEKKYQEAIKLYEQALKAQAMEAR
jgi:hypothetical protein